LKVQDDFSSLNW